MDLTKALTTNTTEGEEAVVQLAAITRNDQVVCLLRNKEKEKAGGALAVMLIGPSSQLKRKIPLPARKADDAVALAAATEVTPGLYYAYLCKRDKIQVFSMVSGAMVKEIPAPWDPVQYTEVALTLDPVHNYVSAGIKAGKEVHVWHLKDNGSDAERAILTK